MFEIMKYSYYTEIDIASNYEVFDFVSIVANGNVNKEFCKIQISNKTFLVYLC